MYIPFLVTARRRRAFKCTVEQAASAIFCRLQCAERRQLRRRRVLELRETRLVRHGLHQAEAGVARPAGHEAHQQVGWLQPTADGATRGSSSPVVLHRQRKAPPPAGRLRPYQRLQGPTPPATRVLPCRRTRATGLVHDNLWPFRRCRSCCVLSALEVHVVPPRLIICLCGCVAPCCCGFGGAG